MQAVSRTVLSPRAGLQLPNALVWHVRLPPSHALTRPAPRAAKSVSTPLRFGSHAQRGFGGVLRGSHGVASGTGATPWLPRKRRKPRRGFLGLAEATPWLPGSRRRPRRGCLGDAGSHGVASWQPQKATAWPPGSCRQPRRGFLASPRSHGVASANSNALPLHCCPPPPARVLPLRPSPQARRPQGESRCRGVECGPALLARVSAELLVETQASVARAVQLLCDVPAGHGAEAPRRRAGARVLPAVITGEELAPRAGAPPRPARGEKCFNHPVRPFPRNRDEQSEA